MRTARLLSIGLVLGSAVLGCGGGSGKATAAGGESGGGGEAADAGGTGNEAAAGGDTGSPSGGASSGGSGGSAGQSSAGEGGAAEVGGASGAAGVSAEAGAAGSAGADADAGAGGVVASAGTAGAVAEAGAAGVVAEAGAAGAADSGGSAGEAGSMGTAGGGAGGASGAAGGAGCPNDADCDTVLDADDNCPTTPGLNQTDSDGDLWGDLCDPYADIVVFEKEDFADPTYAGNQDCLTPAVCVTRDDTDGLFNAVTQSSWESGGPVGTEWAEGTTGETLIYGAWELAAGDPSNQLLRRLSVQLPASGDAFNLIFTRWAPGAQGGGFRYVRAQTTSFTKEDYADWTLPEHQDCIAPHVCLTRKDNQSLFNIQAEAGYAASSPAGTGWAMGATQDVAPGSYQPFTTAVGNNPQSAVGQVMSLNVTGTDVYYDVVITSFSGGNTGGGFSWVRSRALVTGCTDPGDPRYDARANVDDGYYCGDWTRFVKPPQADPTLAANQDCLTSNVCITRGNNGGLFNAVAESSYTAPGPSDTEWTLGGYTAAVTTGDYQPWADALGGGAGDVLPYAPSSLHLITDVEYHDVVVLQWSAGSAGGGFMWVRRPAAPPPS